MPGLPVTEFHRIFLGTFNPEALGRFRQCTGPLPQDSEVTIVNGRITPGSKGGSRTEITDISIWLEGFLNYCTAVEILRQPDISFATTTRIFIQKVIYLSQRHQWKSTLNFALSHHSVAMQKGHLDPENWKFDREDTWSFCNDDTRIRTTASAKTGTPSTGGKKSEVCRNYNTSLCTMDPCKRLHQCSICKGAHKAPNCPQSA